MIDQIGGRKLVAGILVLALGVGAVLLKGDVPPGLLQLLSVVFSAFVVGNIGEHVSDAFAPATPVAPVAEVQVQDTTPVSEPAQQVEQVPSAEVLAKLEEVRTIVQSNAEATAVVQSALSLIISKYGIDK